MKTYFPKVHLFFFIRNVFLGKKGNIKGMFSLFYHLSLTFVCHLKRLKKKNIREMSNKKCFLKFDE